MEKRKLTRVGAIKEFFGDVRQVENKEIMALRAKDENDDSYLHTLGDMALDALGADLDTTTK